MFMAHLPYEKFNELEDRIKQFDTEYLISYENDKYEHFHFIVNITDTEYHNFCQDYFKKKYKLRGRAIKDHPRQYGKETKIRDQEKAIQYTLKDGDYRTNMSEMYIEEMVERSFKKDSKKKEMEKLFEYLDKQKYIVKRYCNEYDESIFKIEDRSAIQTILMDIYIYCDNNPDVLSISRTSINNYFLKYLRTTRNIDVCDKVQIQMIFNGHSRF